MSDFVLDASVVIKWCVPEVHSAEAHRWRAVAGTFHAPTFFDIEIAAILWKKIRRAEITRAQADTILSQVLALPIIRHPDGPLVPAAFDIADQTGRTVYDSLYVALAAHVGGTAVTADLKLFNALSATTRGPLIRWVADVP
jgi:predicted nucleic acid-binding protein